MAEKLECRAARIGQLIRAVWFKIENEQGSLESNFEALRVLEIQLSHVPIRSAEGAIVKSATIKGINQDTRHYVLTADGLCIGESEEETIIDRLSDDLMNYLMSLSGITMRSIGLDMYYDREGDEETPMAA